MDQILLQTKLYVPNIPHEFVERPSLYKKMDLVEDRKLCIISTPAGYGKTSLIAAWARHHRKPLAWITLDEGDNDFSRFFAYIGTAIQKQVEGFNHVLLEKLASPQSIPHQLFLTLFVNALDEIFQSCIVVLDDYHLIHSTEIHEAVQYLLDNLPPQFHIVICSRQELPFSVANLRAKAQLIEFKDSELCFSKGDASEYINQKIGLNLDENEITTLVEYTEGWIVGLRLAALSLAGTEKKDPFISRLGTSNRFIAGYLFDEVLQRQSEEIQTFLLQTSVFDRFTASLCDAALEREASAALIASIENANLFIVPLENQTDWYRYHRKFSELLFDRLKRTDPASISKIYRRASRWFENQGLFNDAIEYAIRAHDFLPAAKLINQNAESLFWTGNPNQVMNWLEVMPDSVYPQFPSLWLLHLLTHQSLAHFNIVAEDLESVRQEIILSHIFDPNTKKTLETSLATIRAIVAINLKYDIDDGLKYAKQGFESYDQKNLTGALALLNYGKACMLNGDLELAKEFLEKASLEIEKAKSPFLSMVITHHLSELAFFQGDLEQTERLLKKAHQIGIENHYNDASAFFRICIDIGRLNYERNELIPARQYLIIGVRGGERMQIAYDLMDGYCAMFDLACLERDFDKTEQIITSLEFLGRNSGFAKSILDRAEAMKTRLAINKGYSHDVRLWLERQDLKRDFSFTQTYISRTMVQALVMLKDSEQAEVLLHRLLSSAEKHQCLSDIVYYRSWLARVLYQQGNLHDALRFLQKAVRISAQQNYVRSVIDVGNPLIELLKIMQKNIPREWESTSVGDYLAVLINASTAHNPNTSAGIPPFNNVSEPLTEREIKTLELLAKGCTNQEIAEAMFVSENTVKFHLKNIYLKLGVHTRTQAAIRARELRLT